MTVELVDPATIEEIVGVQRDVHNHWGRAVSKDQTVYILHSKSCVDSGKDLRYCYYSKALAEGIRIQDWSAALDRPVKIGLEGGLIVPVDVWNGGVA